MSEKEVLWRERLAAWKASGQSLRSFALHSGWRPCQLVYRKNRLEQKSDVAPMIPVEVTQAVTAPLPITLSSPNGWTVQFSNAMPATWLAELLRGL